MPHDVADPGRASGVRGGHKEDELYCQGVGRQKHEGHLPGLHGETGNVGPSTVLTLVQHNPSKAV